MTLLTKEQILGLSHSKAKAQLKTLTKAYNLDEPLLANNRLEAVWEELEDICNNLLWLEDHIARYEDVRYSTLVSDIKEPS